MAVKFSGVNCRGSAR